MGLSLLLAVASCGTTPTAPDGDIQSQEPGQEASPPALLAGIPAAFPDAEGYGATALGSCDRSKVNVFRVSSLADDGPGTLRDAVERVPGGELSVIVFDVAGYIDLESRIDIVQNCLYIAGQTAPGDGLAIRAKGTTGFFLRSGVHDVVIRYLTMRGGYEGDRLGNINIIVGSGNDIVLDHLSLGWTTDKLVAISKFDASWSRPVSNVTLSRSTIAEVFGSHPTGAQISGEDNNGASEWRKISSISLHNNLIAHNSHRNPAITTYGAQFVNNVVYNWLQGATQSGQEANLDVINNYYQPGPMTDSRFLYEVTWDCRHTEWKPSFYVAGNIGPHSDDPTADPWNGSSRMVACYFKTGGDGGEPIPNASQIRRDQPLASPTFPVEVKPASQVLGNVLGDVGANAQLDCDGRLLPNVNPVDARIIRQVRDGTGPSRPLDSESEVGGFPVLASGTACSDQDRDGLPDDFEIKFGLNPASAGDASRDLDKDGYTNMEEYLNGTLPTDPTR